MLLGQVLLRYEDRQQWFIGELLTGRPGVARAGIPGTDPSSTVTARGGHLGSLWQCGVSNPRPAHRTTHSMPVRAAISDLPRHSAFPT